MSLEVALEVVKAQDDVADLTFAVGNVELR
jgi:hypothetical protein